MQEDSKLRNVGFSRWAHAGMDGQAGRQAGREFASAVRWSFIQDLTEYT